MRKAGRQFTSLLAYKTDMKCGAVGGLGLTQTGFSSIMVVVVACGWSMAMEMDLHIQTGTITEAASLKVGARGPEVEGRGHLHLEDDAAPGQLARG